MIKKTCMLCGTPFEPCGRQRCCPACRDRVIQSYQHARQKAPRKKQEQCLICGKPMTHHNAYYTCSQACRDIFRSITTAFRQKQVREKMKRNRVQRNPHLDVLRIEKKAKKQPAMYQLDQHIAAANKLGISYGIYMARKAGML